MQRLINDLLAFSRVGRVSGEQVPVALDAVRDDAIDALAAAIGEAGATISSDPLPVVRGERALLAALFQNLLGNAVKYRRPGVAPVVRITVRATDDGHEFAVADNGIGIDAAHADRVFVIFQRLHSKDEYEGTGIGLALCRKIVELHGGRIWVDPDVAGGAIVRFTLPAADERRPADPVPAANADPMPPTRPKDDQ
jgi:light-regulated signal transduction histidine kinase (bacteriophytochrome)